MKSKISLFVLQIILLLVLTNCKEDQPVENKTNTISDSSAITLFNDVLFYDGYGQTVDYPAPAGTMRISNSKYIALLPNSFTKSIGNNLELEVIVRAACDNYDRIGSVFLTLVEKGKFYDQSSIAYTLEIARFITPFMDKNKSPNEVPYVFDISNIAKFIADKEITNNYDIWIEFDIFGVPYAANIQVAGCQGKDYTFFGTLKFTTTNAPATEIKQTLIPIANKIGFNNYSQTDVIGQTVKTINVEIPTNIKDAKLYLITSNHGANEGGEEYIRREHYIYFDNNLVDMYKPGGKSCEPYRIYNTQGNGIYGPSPRLESEWTSWNNWCPGDKIPIRIYDLGNLSSGNHTFKIEVPDAEFVGSQGDFPLSAYIQGDQQ
ncbi:MAG: hypothetical protein H6612_05390 [Ignavibacteriales bacterium]|nr:hypothetical protein [Ignavibacteriales bacterium]MCB9258771.1 hypothetical protein [Ignavibacteriales bacterium]